VLIALAAAAAAGGFVAGHSGSTASTAALANSASAGSLELSFPSGWQRAGAAAQVPGLTLSQPLVLASAKPAGTLAAGMVDASGPTLLPASFRAQLQAAPTPSDPVQIGNLQAYRYSGLQLKGTGGVLTLYVIPTSAGVATLACQPAGAQAAFLSACERVVATLRLSGAKPFALGPSQDYARLLSTTFDRLRARTSGSAARLRGAHTPTAQHDAAQALAQAYRGASSELAGAAVDPVARDANRALAGALRRLGDAYSAASAAAGGADDGAWGRAGDAIRRGAAGLVAARKALSDLGYASTG
jgi:hypothetical protein